MEEGVDLPIADAVDNTVVFVILGVELFYFGVKHERLNQKIALALVALLGVVLILL